MLRCRDRPVRDTRAAATARSRAAGHAFRGGGKPEGGGNAPRLSAVVGLPALPSRALRELSRRRHGAVLLPSDSRPRSRGSGTCGTGARGARRVRLVPPRPLGRELRHDPGGDRRGRTADLPPVAGIGAWRAPESPRDPGGMGSGLGPPRPHLPLSRAERRALSAADRLVQPERILGDGPGLRPGGPPGGAPCDSTRVPVLPQRLCRPAGGHRSLRSAGGLSPRPPRGHRLPALPWARRPARRAGAERRGQRRQHPRSHRPAGEAPRGPSQRRLRSVSPPARGGASQASGDSAEATSPTDRASRSPTT
jgi:hypothetical protein